MITTRTATLDDLDAIEVLEQSFSEDPKYRASREKFQARIEKFKDGFFLTDVDGHLAYMVCTCCVHYDPNDMSEYTTWDHITHNGYYADQEPPPGANALYIASGVVDNTYQDRNLFAEPYPELVKLALRLNLKYIIAGAIIPGYDAYVKKHGPISAGEYAMTKKGSRLVDPLLEKYRRIHFYVPNESHVIANYYEHPSSLNYSAIVVHDIAKHAPKDLLNAKN